MSSALLRVRHIRLYANPLEWRAVWKDCPLGSNQQQHPVAQVGNIWLAGTAGGRLPDEQSAVVVLEGHAEVFTGRITSAINQEWQAYP